MTTGKTGMNSDYGIGIGLRVPHLSYILTRKPVVDWFEIISENYMVPAASCWSLDSVRG